MPNFLMRPETADDTGLKLNAAHLDHTGKTKHNEELG